MEKLLAKMEMSLTPSAALLVECEFLVELIPVFRSTVVGQRVRKGHDGPISAETGSPLCYPPKTMLALDTEPKRA